jgi:hypothetical protein
MPMHSDDSSSDRSYDPASWEQSRRERSARSKSTVLSKTATSEDAAAQWKCQSQSNIEPRKPGEVDAMAVVRVVAAESLTARWTEQGRPDRRPNAHTARMVER